ncbi:MAG: hypothetical protein KUA43_17520 [Hoeflea sp.]|uniref:hypothetical protein n=1 Tax=Hoeflea sp. TaxID=1940281 RepID=UPI001D5989D2|nr:hypothetical protein [Hoeflea sp.]MBU4529076.1 hypothetical protein [Alphaproteobacteria bacterium]MBU4543481.1 hypothetical protein [Alphaproteobacteria bacterium]MBU4549106.1 hypothetical protein [Alphaproteobacteria bacterium]MBV1725241.1 hypothetical protein [Hoeflea sp.]MBV1785202.1 hypothetical protein [Hoeflea sp.]
MKKIALITVSILALGAAAIAADVDGLSTDREEASFGSASIALAPTAIPSSFDETGDAVIERKIRLVTAPVAPVSSCDAAHWPYYPADCLTTFEPAAL